MDEFEALEGTGKAIRRLRAAGFFIAVVSNQPDAATGKVNRGLVEAINAQIKENPGIDESRVCYEVDDPDATCYKPKPRMQLDSAKHNGLDLGRSHMVGGCWRDVGVGKAAGSFTIFIDNGYRERRSDDPDRVIRALA